MLKAMPFSPGAALATQPVRVAVVDDSVVVRGLLTRWLAETPGLDVVGSFKTGRQIIDALPGISPQVILLDIDMPDMDGLTALPLILAKLPQARVIIVSTLSVHGADLTLRCLMKGATDYIPKPTTNREVTTSTDFRKALVAKVLAVGGGALARTRARPAEPVPAPPRPSASPTPGATPSPFAPFGRGGTAPAQSPFAPAAPSPAAPAFPAPATVRAAPGAPAGAHPKLRPLQRIRPRVVLIGASTGGPQALVALLGGMRRVLPRVPIVIAQHMPPVFGSIFAGHLRQHCNLPATEAAEGTAISAGTIYLAPGGCHTVLRGRKDGPSTLAILPAAAAGPWRPSIDLLFQSGAETCGRDALAIALTGMGRDGTEGGKHLAQAGANIIAQDEASSVVWGIPGSAVEAGICTGMGTPESIAEMAVNLIEGTAS